MLPIYKGIPELFDYTVELEKQRGKEKSCRDSLAIVTYHLLCEAAYAAERAMLHYLTLNLSESFLQNSHHGTPYQKWVKVTNDNFHEFDLCLKSVIKRIEYILQTKTSIYMSSHAVTYMRNAISWMY